MTPDQTETLDKARESAVRLMRFARKAEAQGLTILAQWLKDASVGCQAGVDFQKRALGDNLSTQTERKVIDSKPNPPSLLECSGLSTCMCGRSKHGKALEQDVTRSPMLEGGEKQADAIADAMKRRRMLP